MESISKRWIAASSVVTVSLVALTAWAGGAIGSRGSHHTGISGHTGKNHKLSAGDGFFLQEIEWSERGDKPCYVKATFFRYDGDNYVTKSKELKLCSKKSSSLKRVRLHHPAQDMRARAASSIQVCTSRKKKSVNERLKGIKLHAGILNLQNAKVLADDANSHAQRTHCKRWHDPKKACKSGQLATGLVVTEGTEGSSRGAVVGMGLVCSKPTKTR